MVWEISGPGAFGRAPHPTCFGLLLSGVGSDMVIPQVLLIGLRGFPALDISPLGAMGYEFRSQRSHPRRLSYDFTTMLATWCYQLQSQRIAW